MPKFLYVLPVSVVSALAVAAAHPGHDHDAALHQERDMLGGMIEQGGFALALVAGGLLLAAVLRRRRNDV